MDRSFVAWAVWLTVLGGMELHALRSRTDRSRPFSHFVWWMRDHKLLRWVFWPAWLWLVVHFTFQR